MANTTEFLKFVIFCITDTKQVAFHTLLILFFIFFFPISFYSFCFSQFQLIYSFSFQRFFSPSFLISCLLFSFTFSYPLQISFSLSAFSFPFFLFIFYFILVFKVFFQHLFNVHLSLCLLLLLSFFFILLLLIFIFFIAPL